VSPEPSQPLRPQSAHPQLCPDLPHHLSPGYQETRRSSLSASYTYQDQDPTTTSNTSTTSTTTSPDTSGQDSEHGEVWQDIVRQLAVS